jgi:hypothetical protein
MQEEEAEGLKCSRQLASPARPYADGHYRVEPDARTQGWNIRARVLQDRRDAAQMFRDVVFEVRVEGEAPMLI